jgi:hypothetical protein
VPSSLEELLFDGGSGAEKQLLLSSLLGDDSTVAEQTDLLPPVSLDPLSIFPRESFSLERNTPSFFNGDLGGESAFSRIAARCS